MNNKSGLIVAALLLITITMAFQNCGQPGNLAISSPSKASTENLTQDLPTPEVSDEPNATGNYSIHLLASDKFICEPFGNMNGGAIKGGLKAQLAYVDPSLGLSADIKNSYGAAEYFSDKSQFIKTQTPIFLSQVNVPTRKFDQGFVLSDGSFLADTNNNKLIEWFALQMKSLLQLADTDEEGLYEIATISDDGSRLFLALPAADGSVAANETEIVSNDGAHSTQMRCAANAVSMKKNVKLPMTYYYNQGPRTEIANVMVWRKKPVDPTTTSYRFCNISSQTAFWNPNDSSPSQYWTQLQADGWKVIDAKNFELPNSQINPCAAQNNNLIVDVKFSQLVNGSANLDIRFSVSASIKAKLYKVVGAQPNLLRTYDFSAQPKDIISVGLTSLEVGAIYSIEVLLEMADKGNQVLNEVRFQVK